MSIERIHNVDVIFPYQPYNLQRAYMSKVIECLLRRQHGILESPTGTGKTLSLLCSTLSWQTLKKEELNQTDDDVIIIDPEENLENWGAGKSFPKIIYASRTHTQLSHVMMELQSTVYSEVKKTVLGSRDQLCIHPTVSKQELLSMKNTLCRLHVKEKTCKFANNIDKKKHEIIGRGIVDIEDLLKKSSKLSCCPYYMAKELVETADIVFVPYNYILDPQIRKSLNIKLSDSVVILDEAHNVEKMCEESASVTFTSTDISSAVEEVTYEMNEMYRLISEGGSSHELQREYCAEDLCALKETLQKLEEVMNSLEPRLSSCEGKAYNGSYIFDVLKKAKITSDVFGDVAGLAVKVSDTLVTLNNNSGYSKTGASLRKFAESLIAIFASLGQDNDLDAVDFNFKVYVQQEVIKKECSNTWLSKLRSTTSLAKKVNYWCFNPGFGMSGLLSCNVRCVILTSGTLSPIQATVKELGFRDPVVLENPHIIKPSQVLISVVPKGPRNIELNSSYQNRQNEEYWQELGLTLQNFCRIIPHGVLVFFPSYVAMNKAQTSWQNSGLWQKINSCKPIFVEPQNKNSLQSVVEDYRNAINNGNGGILMGVCRGKISEGFDFTNQYCRGVLITGIPFPPLHDPKIYLKKKYIDAVNIVNKTLSGDVWYNCEAIRAVNQAIGRVIRHSEDFGAIMLCDVRFGNMSVVRYLSKWLRPYVKNLKTFGESISSLHGFFKENGKLPVRRGGPAHLSLDRRPDPKQLGKTCIKTDNNEMQKTLIEMEKLGKIYKVNSAGCSYSDSQPGTSSQSECNIGLTSIYHSSIEQLQHQRFNASEIPDFDIRISPGKQEYIVKNSFIDVQPAKKRKIKLVPVQFEMTTGSTLPNDLAQQKRINEIKDFICEVKQTLDADSYSTFSSVVKKYQRTQCFESILSSLKIIFSLEDETLRNLFKGCERFFTGKDKEEFEKYCKDNNI